MKIENGFYIFPKPPAPALELVEMYKSAAPKNWPPRKKKSLRLDNNLKSDNLPKALIDMAKLVRNPIKEYLGKSANLYGVNVSWAHPVDGKWTSSQLFHRDWRDDNTIKVFTYLTDVDVDQGPFMFIDANNSSTINKKLNYHNDRSHRVSDDVIYGIYDKPIVVTGKAGTTILVDTCACFHCGGRVVDGSRLMSSMQFLRPGHRGTGDKQITIPE